MSEFENLFSTVFFLSLDDFFFFSFQNNLRNLDPSCKIDLDLCNIFLEEKSPFNS